MSGQSYFQVGIISNESDKYTLPHSKFMIIHTQIDVVKLVLLWSGVDENAIYFEIQNDVLRKL